MSKQQSDNQNFYQGLGIKTFAAAVVAVVVGESIYNKTGKKHFLPFFAAGTAGSIWLSRKLANGESQFESKQQEIQKLKTANTELKALIQSSESQHEGKGISTEPHSEKTPVANLGI
jgi:hypothetical protein